MGEFDSIWTTYWLKANPFFTEPLEIDSGLISVENLVGRQEEKQRLTNLIKMGGGVRMLVIGEAGVGKTSLVNYVRSKARQERFISPLKEISIPITADAKQVMVETLVLLFDEINSKGIKLSEQLKKRLEWLQPFADLQSFEGEGNIWEASTTAKLVELFRKLSKELKETGYQGIVLHYNNLDKIKDEETLLDFFQDFRDFIQNPEVIFIFIGDSLLYDIVAGTPRLSQVFQLPSVEVKELSLEEIKEIIDLRINLLRINEERKIELLQEGIIELLYDLFDGNIRHILNSLSFAFQNLPYRNVPRPISVSNIKDILNKAVYDNYLNKLSQTEKDILKVMLLFGKITPTELAKQTKKSLQNISGYYLKKLLEVHAVELVENRGTQKFYAVVPQIRWWKLQKSEREKQADEEKRRKILDAIKETQTNLPSF